MKKFILFFSLCGLLISPIFSGRAGWEYALYVHNIFRANFRTMEGCEAFKYLHYNNYESAKCVRFR